MKLIPMNRETFETWLARMDQDLDAFLDELPDTVNNQLDGSLASLDVLEAWLLERHNASFKELPQRELWVFEAIARYAGEVYRRYAGGQWDIELDIPKFVYHGLPLLRACRTVMIRTCPIMFGINALHRRRGDYMRTFFLKHLAKLTGDAPPPVDIIRERSQKYGIETAQELFFSYWLDMMESAIAALFAEMPAGLPEALDYSPGSLDALESWLLERYPDTERARAPEAVLTMDSVSRYLGETLRRALDAQWFFDLEGWSHGGLPQLRWPAGNPGPTKTLCPLALVRTAIAERTAHVWRAPLSA